MNLLPLSLSHRPAYQAGVVVRSRQAFTLVELLVAVTVIAILSGLLLVGLFPALSRARETAIMTELKQIESAIEQFKTEFGFYPPSFKQFEAQPNDVARVALMSRYLTRISRDHTEDVAAWWTAVGQHIRYQQGDDLVFWLSAIHKNRQFPLTGGTGVNSNFDNGGERHGFYEFKNQQLFIRPVGTAQIASYMQAPNQESPYRYIDAGSYALPPLTPDSFGPFGSKQDAGGGNLVFTPFNPKTFQLFTAGLDNEMTLGGPLVVNPEAAPAGLPPGSLSIQVIDDDNITNFAGGRLSAFVDNFRD